MKNLESLQLLNTNLTLLPHIKNFNKLTLIQIVSDNGAIGESLLPEIGQLNSLSSLELTGMTNLNYLPSEIENLISLQSLTLSQIPNLEYLPAPSIGKLTQLRILKLTDLPKLSNLPTPMENFQQLDTLILTRTNLSSLHLSNLFGLRTLTTDSNPNLTAITMSNIRALQSFSFSNVKSLKTAIFRALTSLTNSSLFSNPLLESVSFEDTPNLTYVDLKGNPLLKTLVFSNKFNMKGLDLSSCQLTSLPDSVKTLTSLERLNLRSNQFSSLPDTFSTDFPNLKMLDLSYNQLQDFVIQFPLIYIKELYLSTNSLTTLDGISKYKVLEILTLDHNEITTIPMEIMKLWSTLQSMTIDYNLLNNIPYAMVNIGPLKSLSASSNKISPSECNYLYQLFNTLFKSIRC